MCVTPSPVAQQTTHRTLRFTEVARAVSGDARMSSNPLMRAGLRSRSATATTLVSWALRETHCGSGKHVSLVNEQRYVVLRSHAYRAVSWRAASARATLFNGRYATACSPFCRQGLRVVASVYDPSGNVSKFCLAFLRYGPQHVEGADVVDAIAFHDDAFGLADAVSCR
jgi:hypothetical protein